MQQKPVEVALAIIYQLPQSELIDGKVKLHTHLSSTNLDAPQANFSDIPIRFLMQLRDDIPGIAFPGSWGLFGGHLEPGEAPDTALIRELQEEISFSPQHFWQFNCYKYPEKIRHTYYMPLTVETEQLVLTEGWDFGLLSPTDICKGKAYSPVADQIRPIAEPTQQILLDFMAASFPIN